MKLCFREVTKSYGSNLALDHFTASLEPGIYACLDQTARANLPS